MTPLDILEWIRKTPESRNDPCHRHGTCAHRTLPIFLRETSSRTARRTLTCSACRSDKPPIQHIVSCQNNSPAPAAYSQLFVSAYIHETVLAPVKKRNQQDCLLILRPTTREWVYLVSSSIESGDGFIHDGWPNQQNKNTARIGIFDVLCSCDLDLDPMTFIFEHDPYYSFEIYRMYENKLRKWRLSKVIVLQIYRQTDRQTDRHDWNYIPAASRMVNQKSGASIPPQRPWCIPPQDGRMGPPNFWL